MVDVPRHRPIEYYNPRPMILGLCFFWGIVMGFCLFYFAPPKQMMRQEMQSEPLPILQPELSERERRHMDTPNIASVEPAPEDIQDQRPRLEAMEVEPPSPLLTTEGGLTGRNAKPLSIDSTRLSTPQPETQPWEQPTTRPQHVQQYNTPPPIPELFP